MLMKIAPITSDIDKQVRANANILSTIGTQPDFAAHLRNGNENAAFLVQSPQGAEAPEIDEAARNIWGTAYDPATRSVKLSQLSINTQAATDAFAMKLGGLLRSEGISTQAPIDLKVVSDGSVRVLSNHPQKSQIEFYFAVNPSLADEYRKISSDNDMVAMGKLSSAYSSQWSAAKTNSQRQAVFDQYRGMFDQAKRLTGQMTLSNDILRSDSLAYASGMVRA